jgi:hypothetical protein
VVSGVVVELADAIATIAAPGEVLASQTIRDLTLGTGLEWTDRGEVALPSAPPGWHVFTLSS